VIRDLLKISVISDGQFNGSTPHDLRIQLREVRFSFAIRGFRLFSPPMPQFTYRARNAQGGLVEGVLDCVDRAVAIRQIESQHCIPIRIDMVEAAKPAEAKASKPPGPQRKLRLLGSPEVATPARNLKIPHGQLLVFTEQLAHLLQAGMTLDEGLSVAQRTTRVVLTRRSVKPRTDCRKAPWQCHRFSYVLACVRFRLFSRSACGNINSLTPLLCASNQNSLMATKSSPSAA
jgi:hypothetical protein